MTYRPYTGVGSRETPQNVLQLMRFLATKLAEHGYTLRSGGADGADSAFENGAKVSTGGGIELYLPWPGFENRVAHVRLTRPTKAAYEIASEYHPAWSKLSGGAKALHARNVHQVLGADVVNPVVAEFVACWTPSGKGGGGTGQAIRIAKAYGVRVFDLGKMIRP